MRKRGITAAKAAAVLEIGTSTVRVLVGTMREDGGISVAAAGEAESRGIRKGEIVNRDDVIQCVRKALQNAEETYGTQIHSVLLVTSGGQAEAKKSLGIHKLVDPADNRPSEVNEGDVTEVMEIARRTALPKNRIKLHTLQQYFQIDDAVKLIRPIGMTGEELRVDMLTLHGKRSTIENFRKIVEDTPVECGKVAFSGLCSALAVANDEQKKTGVLVIDMGGGTSDFLCYHDGFVQAAGSFPLGGEHVTNDISIGLQLSSEQAERVKIKDGSALTNLMERNRNIPIPPLSQGFGGKIVRAVTLNTITHARMEEILTLIKEQIDRQCANVPLSNGVLLTGGASLLNGTRDLGYKVFDMPCAYGKLFDVGGLPSGKEAFYAGLIGAVRYAAALSRAVEKPSFKKKLLKLIWGFHDD